MIRTLSNLFGKDLKKRVDRCWFNMIDKRWVVYLLRCSDESLYCGITNDLGNRLADHNSGKGAKYTRSRMPVELVGVSSEMTKSEAMKLEYRVKQVPAGDKLAALRG